MPTMNEDDGGWRRVATLVNERIAERGLSLTKIEDGSGVSFRSLKKVTEGQGLARSDRLSALATYLGWRGDAFDRIRRGEDPIELTTATQSGPPADADLRDLLGVGGQVVEDRLKTLEARVDEILALLDETEDEQR